MTQLTGDSGFAQKSKKVLLVILMILADNLDGYMALKFQIPASINKSHTSLPDLFTNPISRVERVEFFKAS
jgi:hypothetical protein